MAGKRAEQPIREGREASANYGIWYSCYKNIVVLAVSPLHKPTAWDRSRGFLEVVDELIRKTESTQSILRTSPVNAAYLAVHSQIAPRLAI